MHDYAAQVNVSPSERHSDLLLTTLSLLERFLDILLPRVDGVRGKHAIMSIIDIISTVYWSHVMRDEVPADELVLAGQYIGCDDVEPHLVVHVIPIGKHDPL